MSCSGTASQSSTMSRSTLSGKIQGSSGLYRYMGPAPPVAEPVQALGGGRQLYGPHVMELRQIRFQRTAYLKGGATPLTTRAFPLGRAEPDAEALRSNPKHGIHVRLECGINKGDVDGLVVVCDAGAGKGRQRAVEATRAHGAWTLSSDCSQYDSGDFLSQLSHRTDTVHKLSRSLHGNLSLALCRSWLAPALRKGVALQSAAKAPSCRSGRRPPP